MAIQSVVAVINGQQYTLTLNSSTGKYEATITAPALSSWPQTDHKYGIEVTARDNAGNTTTVDRSHATFGADLALRVLEKVAPVCTPSYPASGARIISSMPTIQWKVTDNDSGVNLSTVKITINGEAITSGITKEAASGGYNCSYTPQSALPEGSNTIKFDVSDNDGNAAAQVSLSFIVDTIAPSLNVSAPAEGYITNNSSIEVTGRTDDATSKPVSITITVNDVDQGAVTLDASGNFSKDITLNAKANVIKITATDQAGKATVVTRNVTLDQAAPVFVSIDVTPNPVDAGKTYVISVKVTDE